MLSELSGDGKGSVSFSFPSILGVSRGEKEKWREMDTDYAKARKL